MKIRRQDNREKNNITAPWLYEFAHDLEKGAYNNVDYLKDYFDKRKLDKKFSSIDEKMADIKERVGFDLARKISEEVNNNEISITSSNTKETSSVKVAKYQHPEEDVRLMGNILKYVKDMIKHEPHLDRATILTRCREEEDLGFSRLRINMQIFSDWIDSQLADAENNINSELVSYIPNEPLGESDTQDWEAEYYRHSKPGG